MAREDLIECEGIVVEVLAGSNFKVGVLNEDGSIGHEVLCYLDGNIRRNRIRVILRDKVRLAISPYDATRGKIIYREK